MYGDDWGIEKHRAKPQTLAEHKERQKKRKHAPQQVHPPQIVLGRGPGCRKTRSDFLIRLRRAVNWLNEKEHDEALSLCTNQKERAADVHKFFGATSGMVNVYLGTLNLSSATDVWKSCLPLACLLGLLAWMALHGPMSRGVAYACWLVVRGPMGQVCRLRWAGFACWLVMQGLTGRVCWLAAASQNVRRYTETLEN